MGCATMLYAIDPKKLRAAVGSKDTALIKRVWKAEKKQAKDESAMDPMNGPRLKITKKYELILNGQRVSLDQLTTALRKREWNGTYLHSYWAPGRDVGPKLQKLHRFQAALMSALSGTKIRGIISCRDEAELLGGWRDSEMSEDLALQELIAGEFTRPDCAHQYGYALERLCRALGTHLATIEGKRGILSHLGLRIPLSEARTPAPLPANKNAPHISYLTPGQVNNEVHRLGSMDLAYPRDAEIEQDRKTLLKSLKAAAKKRTGVVAFYY